MVCEFPFLALVLLPSLFLYSLAVPLLFAVLFLHFFAPLLHSPVV